MNKTRAPDETSCAWKAETCSGDVYMAQAFERYLDYNDTTVIAEIPLCEHHLKEHEYILDLCSKGLDIDDILNMSEDERKAAKDKQDSEQED